MKQAKDRERGWGGGGGGETLEGVTFESVHFQEAPTIGVRGPSAAASTPSGLNVLHVHVYLTYMYQVLTREWTRVDESTRVRP